VLLGLQLDKTFLRLRKSSGAHHRNKINDLTGLLAAVVTVIDDSLDCRVWSL
jgi:hypothetical protein